MHALGTVAVVAALAGAGDLAEGLRLYDALELTAARPHLERARDDSTLPVEDRAVAAVHLGIVAFTLGEEDAAREAFADALSLDWDAALPPHTSPKIHGLFVEVRASLPPPEPAPPPATDASSVPAPAPEPAPLFVVPPEAPDRTLRLALGPRVSTVRLLHRAAETAPWSEVVEDAPEGGRLELVLPPAPGEYFVVAEDAGGTALGQAGSPAVPLRHGLAPSPPPPPLYARWWFWGGATALAGAAAVLAVVLTRPAPCAAPDGQGCVAVRFE